MTTLALNNQQRENVVLQQAYPFKYLTQHTSEFDRVYTWSSFVEASLVHRHNPKAKKIIEIGCGQAGVAAMQNILYDQEIWLIDGNKKGQRTFGYDTVDSMEHYSTWDDLPSTMESWGCNMQKIHFVNIEDAVDYQMPKVDVVQSFRSCGFHYPLDTYKFLYEKQDMDCSFIFTITEKQINKEPNYLDDFIILEKIPQTGNPKINYFFMKKNDQIR
jgi:hypothetical protein